MRPVLFEIPLPSWPLPAGPVLLLVALVALVAAGVGYRRRATDLVTLGLLGAAASAAGAAFFWGRSFTPSSLPVMSYGAMLALSLAAGWVLTLRLAERAGLERDVSAHAYVVAALSGMVGARLLYVLTNPGEFRSPLGVLGFGAGGSSRTAGSFGRRLRGVVLRAPPPASAVLGLGGRRRAERGARARPDPHRLLPLRLRLRPPAGEWARRWLGSAVSHTGAKARSRAAARPPSSSTWCGVGSPRSRPSRSPFTSTQLYEALLGLALFGLAPVSFPKRRRHGATFAWLALAYGSGRFVIEFFRDDPERGHFGPLALALLWVALGFALVGLSVGLGLLERVGASSDRAGAAARRRSAGRDLARSLHRVRGRGAHRAVDVAVARPGYGPRGRRCAAAAHPKTAETAVTPGEVAQSPDRWLGKPEGAALAASSG